MSHLQPFTYFHAFKIRNSFAKYFSSCFDNTFKIYPSTRDESGPRFMETARWHVIFQWRSHTGSCIQTYRKISQHFQTLQVAVQWQEEDTIHGWDKQSSCPNPPPVCRTVKASRGAGIRRGGIAQEIPERRCLIAHLFLGQCFSILEMRGHL